MKKLDINGEDVQNGPVLNRSCTDPICCLIFVAFIAGMAAAAAYGFAKGDPKLLMTSWDADGKNCENNIYRKWMRLLCCYKGLPLSVLASTQS